MLGALISSIIYIIIFLILLLLLYKINKEKNTSIEIYGILNTISGFLLFIIISIILELIIDEWVYIIQPILFIITLYLIDKVLPRINNRIINYIKRKGRSK